MRLKIRHTTHYTFDEPVFFGMQQLRETPKSRDAQKVLNWQTDITGGIRQLSFEDHFLNTVEMITYDRGTTELSITSHGEVEVTDTNGVTGKHLGPAPLWLFKRPTKRTRAGSGIKKLARQAEGETSIARMHSLMAIIGETVSYEVGASEPTWSAEEALTEGKGVCQDHAHIFIACARELDLPARYVSGYLMMDDTIEQDAMHAWAEVYLDNIGWVGFDVSNGICPDPRYVRVATGLDYSDAAPVTGTRMGGEAESLSVQIEVAQQ
ncbi:transglutaminase family protein [Pseudooceanicola sp. C21-150M6]